MPANPTQMTITSAEEIPRELSPSDYWPAFDSTLIYDDELEQIVPGGPWHEFFNGGRTRPSWVAAGPEGRIFLVEPAGFGGPYDASYLIDYGHPEPPEIEDFQDRFDNAYDAFWHCDQRRKTS